ncbi:EAL domain-containing response regulator [Chromobacterium alkanivorans]|uniref:EAL domain-containing response regulator n=1 Tax=Chromobacterium alkanivorans TaxID=1071719 RepID=UPI001967FF86|nr:EAL domain-containing response regulator [Chromobacterium alkanivorans]MBN3002405.1 EAL domain-containing response regulator [Chromobacterium alkanivorans]
MEDLNVMVVSGPSRDNERFQRMLFQAGIRNIRYCGHIHEAEQQLLRDPVDLLVCDIQMPDGGGAELIAKVHAGVRRGELSDAPMLLWHSAAGKSLQESHVRLAREAGFNYVWTAHPTMDDGECAQFLRQVELARAAMAEAVRVKGVPGRLGTRPFSEQEVIEALCSKGNVTIDLQPQVRLRDGAITGAEALARCMHPTRGNIRPSVFLPVVSKLGLDLLLFFHVLSGVIATQQALSAQGVRLPISINASAATLSSPNLAREITMRWDKTQLERSLLVVELTENLEPEIGLDLMVALNQLRANGFGIACDDYGIGISSLKMLSAMPFSSLKLDQLFVASMLESSRHYEIVRSSILLGRELKLQVVAEGVESARHIKVLREMGCEIGQGFGLYRPMAPSRYIELVRRTPKEWDLAGPDD